MTSDPASAHLPPSPAPPNETSPAGLQRQLGLGGAVLLGLGSMVGTGAFVAVALSAGLAGPSVLGAIALAALVALGNALSSAQLAAARPTSGGTYEFAWHYLSPRLGFLAGWLFLLAKTASAASAGIACGAYLSAGIGLPTGFSGPLAAALLLATTLLVRSGLRRSNGLNSLLVAVTLGSLALFVAAAAFVPTPAASPTSGPWFAGGALGFGEATALIFVAFTGYGRIATLGEEVVEPRRTIPRAILLTTLLVAGLYMALAWAALRVAGADDLGTWASTGRAPLEQAATLLQISGLREAILVGATTATLGVLLNLLLGLSRVVLAMARRRDLPGGLALIDDAGSPAAAVLFAGVLIGCWLPLGAVKTTWSFSAFTVLGYYAITNAAALRLPDADRLYPRAAAWLGLISCLLLAFWVEPWVWGVGLALTAAGLVGFEVAQWNRRVTVGGSREAGR